MSVIDELNRKPWKKAAVRKLLIQGQKRILRQGGVSIGWGTIELTCAVGALTPPDKPPLSFDWRNSTETQRLARAMLNNAATEFDYFFSATSANDLLGYKAVLEMYKKAIAMVDQSQPLRLKALIIKRKGE